MWRERSKDSLIAGLPIVWVAAHVLGYMVLRVAPYVWYYAPLVPGLAWMAGYGVAMFERRLRCLFVFLIGAGLLVTMFGVAHQQAAFVLRGGSPPAPTMLISKVLPETKVDIYEQVGHWVSRHTFVTTTIGVSELGVMSYFSQRTAVDFLGLTKPSHASDIRRGDYLTVLTNYWPDLISLPMRNSIYDIDPQTEDWFHMLYHPIQKFQDDRFWGSPMTAWQRTDPAPQYAALPGAEADIGDGWTVLAIESNVADLHALSKNPSEKLSKSEHALLFRAHIRAGAHVGNRTLRLQPVLVDGGDGLNVVSRIVYTDRWMPGEEGWIDFPTTVRRPAHDAAYAIEIGWLETPDIRAHAALLAAQPQTNATNVQMFALSDGYAVGMNAPAATAQGATLHSQLLWRAGAHVGTNWTAFVHLRAKAGNTVAQSDHPLRHQGASFPASVWRTKCLYEDDFSINVPTNLARGQYELVVGLYNPTTGQRMTVDNAPHRTADGGIKLATVTVK